jgi:hypothetical protein
MLVRSADHKLPSRVFQRQSQVIAEKRQLLRSPYKLRLLLSSQ